MTQYEIEFNLVRNNSGLFDAVRATLENNAETLAKMSRDIQIGLEKEALMLGTWSTFMQNSSETIRDTSTALKEIVQLYYNAEKLNFEQIYEISAILHTDSGGLASNDYYPPGFGYGTGGSGEVGEATGDSSKTGSQDRQETQTIPGVIAPGYKSPESENGIWNGGSNDFLGSNGPFQNWDARSWAGFDWSKFANSEWRYVLPLLLISMGAGQPFLHGIWTFIKAAMDQKINGSKSDKDNSKYEEHGDDDVVSSEVTTGCGVTACPEDDFTDAEDQVSADTGIASAAVYVTSTAGVAARRSDNDGSARRFAGGTAGFESVFSEADISSNLSGASIDSSQGAILQPDESKNSSDFNLAKNVSEPAGASNEARTETFSNLGSMPESMGTSGIFAPIVGMGIASVASLAASGAAIGRTVNADKNNTDDDEEKSELPKIAADKSGAVFAGELKGEYVIVATTISLLFSGISVASAVGKNKDISEPTDKFKIGYGTSAIFNAV